MKEIWMVMGFGAGIVAGALLYASHKQNFKIKTQKSKAV